MVLELARPRPVWQIMFSTHHTDVGLMYLVFSLLALFVGGAMAIALRVELFAPGAQLIQDSMTFNRLFTAHGTTMIFLFLLPSASAVGNYLVPIMVRYKDMAYPKLNAIAFWMIPPAAALVWLGMADFGWYANPPYSVISAPAPAAEMWIFGLKVLGVSSILSSINFVVTILKCKHPDLSIGKVPLLAWSFLIIIYNCTCCHANVCGRTFDAIDRQTWCHRIFQSRLWVVIQLHIQHLFWFTFHPEVYVLVIPAIGMMYEIIPRFSRRPIFSHSSGVAAFIILWLLFRLHLGLTTCLLLECRLPKRLYLWLEHWQPYLLQPCMFSTFLLPCGMAELSLQHQ